MWDFCAYTFRAMRVRGTRLTVRLLPAGLLLAGIVLSYGFWPDVRLLLADESLQGLRLGLQLILLLPLFAGLCATLIMRRMLVWPWLWLAAMLLLPARPQLGLVPQLLGLLLELSLLLIFALSETLLLIWRDHWATGRRRLALPAAGLGLLLLATGHSLSPDNPAWQTWMALLAGVGMLAAALIEELAQRRILVLARLRLPQLPALPLPDVSRFKRRTAKSPKTQALPRERPMHSLEQGYLVSHRKKGPAGAGRRRTG